MDNQHDLKRWGEMKINVSCRMINLDLWLWTPPPVENWFLRAWLTYSEVCVWKLPNSSFLCCSAAFATCVCVWLRRDAIMQLTLLWSVFCKHALDLNIPNPWQLCDTLDLLHCKTTHSDTVYARTDINLASNCTATLKQYEKHSANLHSDQCNLCRHSCGSR